ncbi:MAG: hypothetical protein WCV00_23670 [Verrucomicrobiia bacterium]
MKHNKNHVGVAGKLRTVPNQLVGSQPLRKPPAKTVLTLTNVASEASLDIKSWSVVKLRQKKTTTSATNATGQIHEGRPSLRDEKRFNFCILRCATATGGPATLAGEYASAL